MSQNAARMAFRDIQLTTNAINANTATSGAQGLCPFGRLQDLQDRSSLREPLQIPFAAYTKISLSSVRSKTALRSRSFSF
ncbi:hypothetical protein TM1040_3274 (plasmid) [Ruegeria sp. TM1040]|nr:hypothetical protein TM1040_3274 [Ruegeria sp. TM1040]